MNVGRKAGAHRADLAKKRAARPASKRSYPDCQLMGDRQPLDPCHFGSGLPTSGKPTTHDLIPTALRTPSSGSVARPVMTKAAQAFAIAVVVPRGRLSPVANRVSIHVLLDHPRG